MKKRETAGLLAMRADLARMRENGKNYFRYDSLLGLVGRLTSSLVYGLVFSVITYAAVSGILPALMLWTVNMGDVSADQMVADIAANAESLFAATGAMHSFGLAFASMVLLLVISKDVFNPRGMQHEISRESSISTVTKGKPGGSSA